MLFWSTDYLFSWEHLFIQCFWWPICRLRETSQLTSWQIQLAILILEVQRGASGILTTVAAVGIVRIFGLTAIQMMKKSVGRHLIKWDDEIICHVSINYLLQLSSFPHITGEVVHGGLYTYFQYWWSSGRSRGFYRGPIFATVSNLSYIIYTRFHCPLLGCSSLEIFTAFDEQVRIFTVY